VLSIKAREAAAGLLSGVGSGRPHLPTFFKCRLRRLCRLSPSSLRNLGYATASTDMTEQ